MIVKIQRPLMTTESVPQALIYNRSRSFEQMIPFTEVECLFSGTELKIFCKARLDDDKLVIGRKLNPQDW